MTHIPSFAFVILALNGGMACAANLMLDFGATAVGTGYFTLSPGHNAGSVPAEQTTWNTISSAPPSSSLSYADGTTASGITLTMGQESSTGIVNFLSTSQITTTLAGNGGGTNGQQSLFTTTSIYGTGNVAGNTSAARDGFFNSSTAAATSAIGLSLQGLAAGEYLIYVMARNTNSNAGTNGSMNVYASAGANSDTFDFNAITPSLQSNTTYTSAAYAGQYSTYTNGENYVAIPVTVDEGETLFLAVDGVSSSERRGFLNMVQIVAVPEPSTAIAGSFGFLLMLRRKRRLHSRDHCKS